MFNVGKIGLSIRMSSRNDRRGLKAETTPFLKTVYQTLCELTTILAEIQSIKEGKYHALLAFLNPPKVFSHCQKVNPFFAGVVDVKSNFPLFYEFLAFIQEMSRIKMIQLLCTIWITTGETKLNRYSEQVEGTCEESWSHTKSIQMWNR